MQHQPKWMTLTATGKLGLKTATPDAYEASGNDLVVAGPVNCGITIKCDPDADSNLYFATGSANAAQRKAGWVTYHHLNNSLDFGTSQATRVTITNAGRVGVGTTAPGAMVTLSDQASGEELRLDPGEVSARLGGAATNLDLQPSGGPLTVHAGLAEANRVVVDATGRLGVGTAAPVTPIHLRSANPELRIEADGAAGSPKLALYADGAQRAAFFWERGDQRAYVGHGGTRTVTLEGADVGIGIGASTPEARFHVAGFATGNAQMLSNHVAVIENTHGGDDADVLALKVARNVPGTGNNFITFFAGNNAIGAIEGTGGGADNVTLKTTGADFAECLPLAAGTAAIGAGRIVGLTGGAVALMTEGADAVFVTSEAPAVLGNWRKGLEGVEKIALIGQVPLQADGPVEAGDLIEPSGRNDGIGRRFDDTSGELAPAIVGRALGSVPAGTRGTVTVAVGLHAQDVARLVRRALAAQQGDIAELRASLAALAQRLDR